MAKQQSKRRPAAQSTARRATEKLSVRTRELKAGAAKATSTARSKTAAATRMARSAPSRATKMAQPVISRGKEQARRTVSKARGAVGGVKERARRVTGQVRQVGGRVKEQAGQIKDKAQQTLAELGLELPERLTAGELKQRIDDLRGFLVQNVREISGPVEQRLIDIHGQLLQLRELAAAGALELMRAYERAVDMLRDAAWQGRHQAEELLRRLGEKLQRENLPPRSGGGLL